MTYSVKTEENLFTWCGNTMIIYNLFFFMKSIIESCTCRVTNVVMYCDTRIYIYIYVI